MMTKISPGFGYYETIAGGAGEGDDWVGEDGIHVQMPNTRITDPEILEKQSNKTHQGRGPSRKL